MSGVERPHSRHVSQEIGIRDKKYMQDVEGGGRRPLF